MGWTGEQRERGRAKDEWDREEPHVLKRLKRRAERERGRRGESWRQS